MTLASLKIEGLDKAKKLCSKEYVNRCLSQAINNTAKDVKAAEVAEMKKVFRNPTPYTLNSIFIWYSKPDKLDGGVRFREWPKNVYIIPQVEGGTRELKRSEKAMRAMGVSKAGKPYWVPGQAAPLNQYGNIAGGTISKILSRVGAQFGDPLQNQTARSKRRRRGRGGEYVAINFNPRLIPGIYQREGRKLRPVLIFIKEPHYRKLFDFYGVGQRIIDERFNYHFGRALNERIPR